MGELARLLELSFSRHSARCFHRLDDRTLSYGDLDRQSAAIAHFLSGKVARGRPVLLFGERGAGMLAAMFGCLRAGNPYVPAGELLPVARCRQMARAADCGLALWVEGDGAGLSADGLEVVPPDEVVRLTAGVGRDWRAAARGNDIAYVLFTSGSTGHPKGVRVSAGNLEAFLGWTVPGFGYALEPATFLNQAPFHFDLSVYETYNAAVTGGSLTSLPGSDSRSPELMFSRLFAYSSGLDVWVSTPSFLRYCVSHPEFSSARFPRLRQFVLIGETFPLPLAREVRSRFPGARVLNFYGPTEATVAHTVFEVTSASLEGRVELPVGRSMPGSTVSLEEGEIVLAGPNVAHGYLNANEAEDRKFYEQDGVRHYRTGDRGEFDAEGLLYYRGRLDTQVKINGFRVELAEVERALGLVPEVDGACAMLVQTADGSPFIAAFLQAPRIVAETEPRLRVRLREALSQRLPGYMIPRRFVLVNSFPLTRNGKLDREALRGLL